MAHYIPRWKCEMVREGSLKVKDGENKIQYPEDAYRILRFIEHEDRENFVILMLNTKNRIIGINTVSIGSLNASLVHPREVFKPAIVASAAAIMLCHNHPSGDPSPSPEDLEITERLCKAGELLGIDVLDHIIIGDHVYASLREKGLIV